MAGLFGFGSGTNTTGGTVTPSLPSNVQPGFNYGINEWENAQQNVPSLSAQYANMPQLQVPNLTPEQQAIIQQLVASGQTSPALQAANQQLQQLTSGPIGSSPATQQAMAAYNAQVVPQLLQQQALAGRGSGGAALEAVAQGEQSAMVPLLQREIATRQAAVNQYGQLQGETMQSLAASLEAAGLPREVAQQQAAAAYARQQQQQQFAQGLQSVPIELIPSLISRTSTGTAAHQGGWGEAASGGLGALGTILGGQGGGGMDLSSLLGMFGGGGGGGSMFGGGATGTSVGDPSGVGGMAGSFTA